MMPINQLMKRHKCIPICSQKTHSGSSFELKRVVFTHIIIQVSDQMINKQLFVHFTYISCAIVIII